MNYKYVVPAIWYFNALWVLLLAPGYWLAIVWSVISVGIGAIYLVGNAISEMAEEDK